MMFTPGDIVEVQGTCWSFDKPPFQRNPMTVKLLPKGASAIFIEEAVSERTPPQRALRILHDGALMWVPREMMVPYEGWPVPRAGVVV